MNDYENVKKFKKLIFELHFSKKCKEIIKQLSNDFDCEVRKGKVTYLVRCRQKSYVKF
ncbi:hypothetical protein [Acidianus sp. HS-5]|uniref:hypothetical protein n=1 Tax=Acidianus sp. HS-5 TaxID=2886040 RepID=UPI001F351722|nr:hypothetical protein [Acidianus sp. HS-5]BDC18529.1 hypothetical protein HS5_14190 [Acidianus sp. HS-5]